jgi:hypothetical protein
MKSSLTSIAEPCNGAQQGVHAEEYHAIYRRSFALGPWTRKTSLDEKRAALNVP